MCVLIKYVESLLWLLNPTVTGPHSGSVRLRLSSSDLGWSGPSEAQHYLPLMDTKPLAANSVWSQLSPNLRPAPPLIIADEASLLTLPESIQPGRAAFTCKGINDSGQEIPHLILISSFFKILTLDCPPTKAGLPSLIHLCTDAINGKRAPMPPHNKGSKTPQ